MDFGRFSEHDPKKPRVATTEFIHEKKTRQRDDAARVEVLEAGPVRARVKVSWKNDRATATQVYTFYARQPWFQVETTVEPKADLGQELVALDARFQANDLAKCFPNFIGMPPKGSKPHFGWRQGAWIPDVVTLMTPPQFDESLSILVLDQEGLTHVRQGFWPENRPKAGPPDPFPRATGRFERPDLRRARYRLP